MANLHFVDLYLQVVMGYVHQISFKSCVFLFLKFGEGQHLHANMRVIVDNGLHRSLWVCFCMYLYVHF